MLCSHEKMSRLLCKCGTKYKAKQSDSKIESSLGFLYSSYLCMWVPMCTEERAI